MKLYIILILLCFSCRGVKKVEVVQVPCTENMRFKDEFFKHTKIVDDYMKFEAAGIDIDEYLQAMSDEKVLRFKASLLFISKYSHISFESMVNYSNSYPLGVYWEDKENWLKWYEENKCDNIQFKD